LYNQNVSCILPIQPEKLDNFYRIIIKKSQDPNETFDSLFEYVKNNLNRATLFNFKFPLNDENHAKQFAKVLKIKAQQANLFVPVIESCEYISKTTNGFIRRIKISDNGPTIQEHVLLDKKSFGVLFVEEWEELNAARVEGRFVAWNNVIEEKGLWYFVGTYLYNDTFEPEVIEKQKAMFQKTYENMILFLEKHDIESAYLKLKLSEDFVSSSVKLSS